MFGFKQRLRSMTRFAGGEAASPEAEGETDTKILLQVARAMGKADPMLRKKLLDQALGPTPGNY